MHKIPWLDRAARRRLIRRAKKARDPHTASRYIMIAKLGQGLSRQQIARNLACIPSAVVKAARRFAEAGEEGLRALNGFGKVDAEFKEELGRVLYSVPTDSAGSARAGRANCSAWSWSGVPSRRSRSAPSGGRSRPSLRGSRHRGSSCSAHGSEAQAASSAGSPPAGGRRHRGDIRGRRRVTVRDSGCSQLPGRAIFLRGRSAGSSTSSTGECRREPATSHLLTGAR